MFEIKSRNQIVLYELRTLKRSFTIEYGEMSKTESDPNKLVKLTSFKSEPNYFFYFLSLVNKQELSDSLEIFDSKSQKSCNNLTNNKDKSSNLSNKPIGFELFLLDSNGFIYKKKLFLSLNQNKIIT